MLEPCFFDTRCSDGLFFNHVLRYVAMKSKRLLIVVYDGIQNSVFESLVFEPAKKRILSGQFSYVDIVSFEVDPADARRRANFFSFSGISILIHKKIPFLGKASLFLQAPSIARQLSNGWYDSILARGPLAGYILKAALTWFVSASHPAPRTEVTVQARGLACEEARLTFNVELPHSIFRKYLFNLKLHALRAIEAAVYDAKNWPQKVSFTSVSDALRDYLIKEFNADSQSVVVDDFDCIARVDASIVHAWRKELRDFLKIPADAVVYGYSGSCKQWQCAEETIEFIAKKIDETPMVYGIVLSTDLVAFQAIIAKKTFDKQRLLLRYVAPRDVTRWLSLCDYGVLLRYEDVVNWVSRPTKALEYLSVGLSIIHNNTVKWLIDYDAQKGAGGSEITPQPTQTLPL